MLGLLQLPFRTSAQYYYYNDNYWERPWLIEGGISIGGMNCLTDIGGGKGSGKSFIKDLNLSNTTLAGGFFIEATYEYTIGFRIETCFGTVKAYDSILKDDKSVAQLRYQRNLHFRSPIREFSFLIEFHPMNILSKKKPTASLFSPYFIGGISLFQFNPQANYEGSWVDLEPLKTEGQGFKDYPHRNSYRLKQAAIPLGLGLRYEVSAIINLRLELNYRILFTDYLDDVSTNYIDPTLFDKYLDPSQARVAKKLADRRPGLDPNFIGKEGEKRGNPSNNDAWLSLNLKLGVVLNRKRRD